jgi:hypothetical protein
MVAIYRFVSDLLVATEGQMASQPSLRIGDVEREAVAAELREHYAQGRLTLEEFNHRIDAAFAAKTQRDLSHITSDLPHVRPAMPLPSSGLEQRRTMTSLPSDSLPHATLGAPGAAGAAWTAPGGYYQGGNWQGSRRCSGGGFGALTALLAALATWLLVYDVILVGLRVPLPGRLGLLIAIYTVIRGLLRRILRGNRGRRVTALRYSGRRR